MAGAALLGLGVRFFSSVWRRSRTLSGMCIICLYRDALAKGITNCRYFYLSTERTVTFLFDLGQLSYFINSDVFFFFERDLECFD